MCSSFLAHPGLKFFDVVHVHVHIRAACVAPSFSHLFSHFLVKNKKIICFTLMLICLLNSGL